MSWPKAAKGDFFNAQSTRGCEAAELTGISALPPTNLPRPSTFPSLLRAGDVVLNVDLDLAQIGQLAPTLVMAESEVRHTESGRCVPPMS